MIKPKALQRGDAVAVVSLSSGMGGEELFRYRYEIAKQRLEEIFGLQVIAMPNALKGITYLDEHPQARAQDLMQAFQDEKIKGIICMIGGDDSIRLLPYIDYDIIRNNPKVFMGYSDTTINHFMMHKAGIVSFQGPCMLVEFAENVQMHDYTIQAIRNTLFQPVPRLEILPSGEWTSEMLNWTEPANQKIKRKMTRDEKGYEVLQGQGKVSGRLLGGCLSVFGMMIGTEIWPAPETWSDKILFLETAEDYPEPDQVKWLLRNLLAQGILGRIQGILVGKPLDERYYEEYKEVYRKVVGQEAKRPELPIMYNVNCSHTSPVCILPNGIMAEIDCDSRKLTLLEEAVISQ